MQFEALCIKALPLMFVAMTTELVMFSRYKAGILLLSEVFSASSVRQSEERLTMHLSKLLSDTEFVVSFKSHNVIYSSTLVASEAWFIISSGKD